MSWSEQIWLVATFSYLIWILLLWYIIIDVMTSSPHRILTPSNTNITTCKLSLYYHFSSLPLYLLPAYVPSTSLFTFQCHPFLLLLCILMYPSQPKKNIFTNACRSNSKEGFVFLFCFLFFFGWFAISLPLITFFKFFSFVCVTFFSSRCMLELKFTIYHRAASLSSQTSSVDVY